MQISLYGDCFTLHKDYQAIKLHLSHTHTLSLLIWMNLNKRSRENKKIQRDYTNPKPRTAPHRL
jgi:hypothetical protein